GARGPMFFLDNIWIFPLLPAFGAAMMFFFGRRLSKQFVNGICVGVLVLAVLMSVGAVVQLNGYMHGNDGKPFERVMYTWLGSDSGRLTFTMHNGQQAEFKAE